MNEKRQRQGKQFGLSQSLLYCIEVLHPSINTCLASTFYNKTISAPATIANLIDSLSMDGHMGSNFESVASLCAVQEAWAFYSGFNC